MSKRVTDRQADYLIDHRLANIPCVIAIYGLRFRSCEWQILDRNCYPAKWLEAKMTGEEEDHVWYAVRRNFESWLGPDYQRPDD